MGRYGGRRWSCDRCRSSRDDRRKPGLDRAGEHGAVGMGSRRVRSCRTQPITPRATPAIHRRPTRLETRHGLKNPAQASGRWRIKQPEAVAILYRSISKRRLLGRRIVNAARHPQRPDQRCIAVQTPEFQRDDGRRPDRPDRFIDRPDHLDHRRQRSVGDRLYGGGHDDSDDRDSRHFRRAIGEQLPVRRSRFDKSSRTV